MIITKVNWHHEDLDNYYGHDNEGFIHGLYLQDHEDQWPALDVQWFRSESERERFLNNLLRGVENDQC